MSNADDINDDIDLSEPMAPITPEAINLDDQHPGYAPGGWDYPTRCADADLALAAIRERIEEWDPEDKHGWWHERTDLIAVYNEVARLRRFIYNIGPNAR